MRAFRWRYVAKSQPAVIVVPTAIGAGVLSATFSTASAYLVLALAFGGLALGARSIFGGGRSTPLAGANSSDLDPRMAPMAAVDEGTDTTILGQRAPELFFYVGMLTIGLPAFRIGWATVSDLLFLAALLLSLTRPWRHSRPPPLPGLLIAGAIIYALGALLATSTTPTPLESLAVAARFMYLLLAWFWLASTVLSNVRKLERAVILWVSSAALSGVGSLAQLLGIRIFEPEVDFYNRMIGFTQHPNDLGGLTGIALLPALVLASRKGVSWHLRTFALLVLLFVAIGLLLSGSVSGLTAAVVAIAVWLSLAGRRSVFSAIPLLALVAVILLISASINAGNISPIRRIAATTATDGSEGTTLWDREETNRVALQWLSHHPFIGVGLDSASRYTSNGLEVHNLLLGAWFTTGLLGLAGMAIILLSVFMAGRSVLKTNRGRHLWFHTSTIAAFLGSFAFAMSAPIIHQRYAWTAAALVLVCWRLNNRMTTLPDVAEMAALGRTECSGRSIGAQPL